MKTKTLHTTDRDFMFSMFVTKMACEEGSYEPNCCNSHFAFLKDAAAL